MNVKLIDGYFYYLSGTGWKLLTSYGGNYEKQLETLIQRVRDGQVKMPKDYKPNNLLT